MIMETMETTETMKTMEIDIATLEHAFAG